MTRHYVREMGDIQDIAEKIMDTCGARPQARLRTVMERAVRAPSGEARMAMGGGEGASGEAAYGVRERAGHLLRVP